MVHRILAANRLLIGLILAHFLTAVAFGAAYHAPFDPGMAGTLLMLFTVLLPWFFVILIVWRFIQMAIYVRPEKPISHLLSGIKSVVLDFERIANGLFRLVLITLFVGSFAFLKSIVPLINPFEWDIAFAQLDRLLHFGRDPYVLLAPLFGTPLATTALNALYHLWFFLLYFLVFLACFAPKLNKSGTVFLLAFVFVFALGGNLLATVFSSAGPVYYQRLGYGDDFATLMTALNQSNTILPVWALDVQEELWKSHIGIGVISGISAMPSMHVASTTLLALYGFKFSRWAGIALSLFALSIMIGSVHLGWHYAVDGYFGAILALACWRFANFVADRGSKSQSYDLATS